MYLCKHQGTYWIYKPLLLEYPWKWPKIGGGGGVAAFVDEKFDHLVKVIPNKNEDYIWIKIKKEFCGETEDISIGTFYVTPAKMKRIQN